jgi:hypothetical protein
MERDTTAFRQHADRWIISVDGHDLLWCTNRKSASQLVCAARKLAHRSEAAVRLNLKFAALVAGDLPP